MPYIADNIAKLRRRHYIRNATAANCWFDFASNKVNDFVRRYGDDFCLVINASRELDDAYVIPYSIGRQVFTQVALDARGRWVGTILDSNLVLVPSHNSLRVASYHNAFKHFRL